MGRGAEKLVRCEKCGRTVARNKAVYIEKPVLQNPLERKDVHSEHYTRVLTREVCYCISCGKHGRVFEKKKKMNAERRERAAMQFNRPRPAYRPQYDQGKAAETAVKKDSITPEGMKKDLEETAKDSLETFTDDEYDKEKTNDYLEELTQKKHDKMTEDSVGALTEEEVEDDDKE
ncbi:hypothetical protein HUU53_04270 [Candidatus Micrarchaeota archaeon]|nr:hypothetical protein [Candidatus Micrarchaeota archaeon]